MWTRYLETKQIEYLNEDRAIRNKVRKETRSIEQIKQRKIALQSKSNPKAVWSYIKNKTVNRNYIGDQ